MPKNTDRGEWQYALKTTCAVNPRYKIDLNIAVEHVVRGRQIVARQRERIARLKASGCSVEIHEQTLRAFLGTLKIFEEHERQIRDALRRPLRGK